MAILGPDSIAVDGVGSNGWERRLCRFGRFGQFNQFHNGGRVGRFDNGGRVGRFDNGGRFGRFDNGGRVGRFDSGGHSCECSRCDPLGEFDRTEHQSNGTPTKVMGNRRESIGVGSGWLASTNIVAGVV